MAAAVKPIAIDYSVLNRQWAPYLTKKQWDNLQQYSSIIAKVMIAQDAIALNTITHTKEQIEKLHKRVQKRMGETQAISSFIDLCITSKQQLTTHIDKIHAVANTSTDTKQIQKSIEHIECGFQFKRLLDGLQMLAENTKDEFEEKRFDKGVATRYPEMLKKLASLIQQANLQQRLEEMPEHPIKKDIQTVLQNSAALLQWSGKFSSSTWILVLEGFSVAARNLIMPQDKEVAQFKQQLSDVPIFLNNLLDSCKKQLEIITTPNDLCKGIIDINLNTSEQRETLEDIQILEQQDHWIYYFTHLKQSIERTKQCFDQNKIEGVRLEYPTLIQNIAKLFQQPRFQPYFEKILESNLKKDIRKALKDEPVSTDYFDIQNWCINLLVLYKHGESWFRSSIERNT